MQSDEILSRNQERFLNELLLGKSVPEAGKTVGISPVTAWRWSKNPVLDAERRRRETVVSQTEQDKINEILLSGFALEHKRVQALNALAELLQEEVFDPEKRWLPDVKTVGYGASAERVDLVQFNSDLVKEFRATLADVAAERGHRVKKSEVDARIEASGNVAVYLPQKHDLRENDANSDDESSSGT